MFRRMLNINMAKTRRQHRSIISHGEDSIRRYRVAIKITSNYKAKKQCEAFVLWQSFKIRSTSERVNSETKRRGGGPSLSYRKSECTTEFPEVIGNTLDYETSGAKMKGSFDPDTRQLHI